MATWVIGDIHGCWLTLERLLEEIEWTPDGDDLWLVGDLVNRGPASLEVLRWAADNDAKVSAVLGNHDLHLLARACGVAASKKKDTLDAILDAPDRDDLLEWLRARPMMHKFGPFVIVHAGLAPEWNIELAQGYAEVLHAECTDGNGPSMLESIHAHRKEPWHVDLDRGRQLSAAAIVMTRIRMVGEDGRAVLDYTGPPGTAPAGLRPWFSTAAVVRQGYTVVFGHWAMLGFYRARDIVCLDSGCVYGGRLTAVRLDDGRVVQQPLVDLVGTEEPCPSS
jgi:bis(5'-nucleosyl)-tetraphosphatase (symmetrical)